MKTQTIFLASLIVSSLALPAAAQEGHPKHWGYQGEVGPEHWQEFESDFGTCSSGRNQSPVDLASFIEADLPQIASLTAPRPLWLYRVPEERVGFSSRRYYDWTRRSFQSLGEQEALRMSTAAAPDAAVLVEWLRKRMRRARR